MKAIILAAISVLALAFFAYQQNLQAGEFNLQERDIQVTNDAEPTQPAPVINCNVASIMHAGDGELMAHKDNIAVGTKEIYFNEKRYLLGRNGQINETTKFQHEPERKIALLLLDTQSCETKVILVTIRGLNVIAPAGYKIEMRERVNGIRWNYYNTEYQVLEPEHTIVLANLYPFTETAIIRDKHGRRIAKKIIQPFLYVPYSQGIHSPELVRQGAVYIRQVVQKAFDKLRELKVASHAFPDKLVADVPYLRPEYFLHLPILEQTDMTEFIFDSVTSAERVLVMIGSNRDAAFSKTCSRANACGWVQYTPGTYSFIRKQYPDAKLDKTFATGSVDLVNSMMAAILLYDSNLAALKDKYGDSVLADPLLLEEYLASAYNGGIDRVKRLLSATILVDNVDWLRKNRNDENMGYVIKIRILRELGIDTGQSNAQSPTF